MKRHDYEEFQAAFKASILSGRFPDQLMEELAENTGLPAMQRMQVHVNNFRETLSASLAGIFPVLETFVGATFVAGALKEYCLAHPPVEASLAGYGADFADFLEGHRATEHLAYLPDIVRLEWAIHCLQLVDEMIYPAIAPERLLDEAVSLGASANMRLVASEYPLMSLWSAAIGQIAPEAVHLGQGGQSVAILLKEGSINLIALDAAERAALTSVLGGGGECGREHSDQHKPALGQLIEKSILVNPQN